jgi:hypothetical protein
MAACPDLNFSRVCLNTTLYRNLTYASIFLTVRITILILMRYYDVWSMRTPKKPERQKYFTMIGNICLLFFVYSDLIVWLR